MHDGLYLGGVQLPFVSHLRVYLPREAYSPMAFDYLSTLIQQEQNPVSVDVDELSDSLMRVSRASADPFPNEAAERVRIFRFDPEAPPLYAPNQMVRRSVEASSELLDGPMAGLARLIITEDEWEKHTQLSPRDESIQTRVSTWGIPFSWFTLIYANDRMEVVEANGRVLTVRIQVPLEVAAERVSRTLAMLAEMAPELELFEELADLHEWLASFNHDGVVELDYGSVAQWVHPDESPADVHAGLASLAEGDLGTAAAAYRRLANRWLPIRARSRAN